MPIPRSSSESESDEGLASDSDDEVLVGAAKRQRITVAPKCADMPGQAKANPAVEPKRNNVWGRVMLDQSLQDALNGVDVVNEADRIERGSETFSAPQERQVETPEGDSAANTANGGKKKNRKNKNKKGGGKVDDEEMRDLDADLDAYHKNKGGQPSTSTDSKPDIYNPDEVEKRFSGKAKFEPRKRKLPQRPNLIAPMDKSPELKPGDPPAKVGVRIAKAIGEPKINLIVKVAQVLGSPTAIELFQRTRDIEASGGMVTADGKRRRTAGGVFLQLVKDTGTDSEESQAKLDKIFAEDNKRFVLKSKKSKKAQRKERMQAHIDSATGFSGDLRDTLTKIKQLKDAKELFLEEALAASITPKAEVKAEIVESTKIDEEPVIAEAMD